MVSLSALWLPIVVSAVIVFIVSSILHMVLPYHRSDFSRLPHEDEIRAALRSAAVKPGAYMFPFCGEMKEMGSPEQKAKFEQGPVGMLTVLPNGMPAMPKYLAQWFVYSLVIGLFAAYLASRTLAPGTHYLQVFRVVGCTTFLAYAGASGADSIWRGVRWSTTFKNLFDGLVYGLMTAGVFGWLWPAGV
jgi:hypothetical protein